MHEPLRPERRRAMSVVEPPTDADERRLLARVAAHDRHAMQEFYLLYHRRLVRFLARVTRRRELVDEIINDTLLIVWQHAARFRGESRISTWVMGIAWRQGLRSCKREQRAAAYPVLPEISPEPEAERMESRDTLDRAMQTLSSEQCAVIDLAYVGGYSCEEIGAIIGCPANTVKTRLFYARRKLRAVLEAEGATRADKPAEREPDGTRTATELRAM
ncbi:MAG TPA: sigma-70 family RNA polymerase sigma factor [Steroidobacteraceae bacterium]